MARLALVLLVMLATPSAHAEAVAEHASLRLRYGLSLRDGRQADVGPGLTYEGFTPNDVAAVGTAWLGTSWLGAWAGVQREAFDLREGALRITGGSLWRGSAGPRARFFLGPVRAELGAGYGFSQLPHFSDSTEPVLLRGVRHAAVVGGSVRFPLMLGLRLEARGELPVSLSVRDATGARAEATGFSAGGALLVPLRRAERWTGTLVLDFQHVQDTVTLADGTQSRQRLRRMGAALELAWHDGARVARQVPVPVAVVPGSVRFHVLDARTGAPLPGARVMVAGEAHVADAQGLVEVASLSPGPVSARVTAEGYASAEATATVEEGRRAELEVRAAPLPPPTGALRVTVVDARTGVPLPDIRVSVGTAQVRTDLTGQAVVKDLAPGPVAVAVASSGFQSADEAAVVIAGQESTLSVPLATEKQGTRATLVGQVRSVRGGKPLAATLLITKARVRARTDSKGAFNVQVRGGTYRITLSARGHLSQTKVITLREGERTILNVDLFPRGKR
ncbi:carboxypeptidase regulatory-like domain-containing protein [Myxococcus sp. SDU36]|uniref:MSCRAMM family protein n=1 Tax=Myxococcus sp. SDU36 TaxID=2831967 RepID=UPI002542DDE6|nr:carboxypeptidase regulatory-like domain-containing protein [Myxococcus sp. SDU36]